jgi:hypothetical protein
MRHIKLITNTNINKDTNEDMQVCLLKTHQHILDLSQGFRRSDAPPPRPSPPPLASRAAKAPPMH